MSTFKRRFRKQEQTRIVGRAGYKNTARTRPNLRRDINAMARGLRGLCNAPESAEMREAAE